MTRLFLDFETFSEAPLLNCGTDRYVRHDSTRALMLAWAFDEEPVEQRVFAQGEAMPDYLRNALIDPSITKSAWNAVFERVCFREVLGIEIPIPQWECTMALASSLSLPASLDKAGLVLNLDDQHLKMATKGRQLIKKFCVPRKPTKNKPWTVNGPTTDPDDWADFVLYNRRDVEAERACWRRMVKWAMSPTEQLIYQMDQEINDKGIPINMTMVDNACRVYEELVAHRVARLRELTGCDNPNSPSQLLEWALENGYSYNDLKIGHVKQEIARLEGEVEVLGADEQDLVLLEVMQLRAEIARTSPKKYSSLQQTVDLDSGVVRYVFAYGGAARTLRWAGRMLQPHNLPRPERWFEDCQQSSADLLTVCDADTIEALYEKPFDLLASCVRPVIQAGQGYVFCDADLNAIENRGVGWIANDDKILQVFRDGKDPYIDFAWRWLGGTYEERWHQYKVLKDKSVRTLSKPPVLGCAYGLGAGQIMEDRDSGEITATGLLGYAWALGVKDMNVDQSGSAVKTWRAEYVRTVEFWSDLEQAAKRALRTGRAVDCGPLTFDMSGPFLRMRLPSGRCIHYCRPELQSMPVPWAPDDRSKNREMLTYWGMNDKNQWALDPTRGPKLLENATQAIARDVLANGMLLARKEGLDIRVHVHDQIAVRAREEDAEATMKTLIACMSETPAWAKGLPLAAEGSISRYFVKD